MRVYSVDILVSGPVTVSRVINFNTDKELNFGNIFRSNILIKKHPQGFSISSTVYTADPDRAYKVALLFIGRMLDILSMKINMPLNASISEYRSLSDKNIVKAVINEEEFSLCFELSRQLNLHEDKLLRAFSWYRKGLYTEDPFDKFLAFWNSISVVADGYCNDNNRTRAGSINKIWDCFNTLWGVPENWSFTNGNGRWINENHEIRSKIAHGGMTVDIQYVENVITQLDAVQNVAFSFLKQWAVRLNHQID